MIIQYSADNLSWHEFLEFGDSYFRISEDEGATWWVLQWATPGMPPAHNSLGGLQGGDSGTSEYFHLTEADYNRAAQAASAVTDGYLTATDWNTFNDKLDPDGSAQQLTLDSIPGSTYNTVQEYVNVMNSPGLVEGGGLSIISSTQVRVAAGNGMIRIADDNVSALKFFNWSLTDLTIPNDDVVRYFGVKYNGGTPIVEIRTSSNWDNDTEFELGSALRGTVSGFFILSNPMKVGDPITNIIQRFDANAPVLRDAKVGGLIISNTGTRNIAISGGLLWHRLNDNPYNAFDSSGASRFTSVYYTSGVPTYTPSVAQWPNDTYNDPATGLVTMSNNKYANLWFYIGATGTNTFMVYGRAEYNTEGDALAEMAPQLFPSGVSQFVLLVGKLTFKKGDATPRQLQSPFTLAQLGFGSVNTHNDLSGLQGGATNEYYHLTVGAYNNISAGTAATPTFAGLTSPIGQETPNTGIFTGLASQLLTLSLPAGNYRPVRYETSGSLRWLTGVNASAESGSNAGSDFEFARYNDAGSYLGSSIIVRRDTGLVDFENNIRTGAPSGGTAQPWKLGNVTSGLARVEINGSPYDVALSGASASPVFATGRFTSIAGGTATPAIHADKTYGTTGDVGTAIRCSLNGGDGGGYFSGYNVNYELTHNAEFVSGSGWTARHTFAAQMVFGSGEIVWNINTGLTSGSTFSPTLALTLTPSGLKTTAPSGGSAQPWKFGNYSSGTVRVEIGGTAYPLTAVPA